MSKDSLRLPDYLNHILEAIARIQEYCEGIDKAAFFATPMVQDAVIRNFEIIGEASRNIERVAPAFVTNHPEIPLLFAYDMRNVLAHGYYKVELDVVWTTIEQSLPAMKEQIASALQHLNIA